MSNRQIEAILKITAKAGSLKGLDDASRKLQQIERQALAFNRTNSAMSKAFGASWALMSRGLAPAAAAYAGVQAVKQYADVERQLTRTGLTIGATREEMTALRKDVEATAKTYALPAEEIMATVDAYVAAGAEMKELKADLDTLAKAQQALGANGTDIVQSWDAARKTFRLASQDAEKFFEIIGAGSAAGKVEARDLAQMMPSLLPVAARHGLGGLADTERLVAALEAMADFTGSPSEAATSMNDFLEKISSPAVEKAFKGAGIDLPKRLKQARKEGRDLFQTMHDIMKEATKGDPTRIGQFFGDKEARRAADMILNRLEAIESAQQRIAGAKVDLLNRNTKQLLDDAKASIDRLSESFDQLATSAGRRLVDIGVPKAMDFVSDQLDQAAAIDRALDAQGMTPMEKSFWKLMSNADPAARRRMAYAGGYRTAEQRFAEAGKMVDSPEMPHNSVSGGAVVYDPKGRPISAPVPTPRPVETSSRPRRHSLAAEAASMEAYFAYERELASSRVNAYMAAAGPSPQKAPPISAREAEDQSMSSLRRDPARVSAAIGDALQSGADRAGQRIEGAGSSLADSLQKGAAALLSGANAIDSAAARLAGARFGAMVGPAPGRDVGNSGGDVTAPAR